MPIFILLTSVVGGISALIIHNQCSKNKEKNEKIESLREKLLESQVEAYNAHRRLEKEKEKRRDRKFILSDNDVFETYNLGSSKSIIGAQERGAKLYIGSNGKMKAVKRHRIN